MSAIADYISNAYSDSASGLSSVGDFTFGGLDSSTMFGSKSSSTTGIRLPSQRSSEKNTTNIATGINTGNFNLANYQSPEVNTTPTYEPSTPKQVDLSGALKGGVELFQQFRSNRNANVNTSINTDPTQGGAAGMVDGVPVDMEEVTVDGNAGTDGAGGGGGTGGSFNYGAAGEAAAMVGQGIEMAFDDEDATKWNAGEVTGSVLKGAGKGAAMGTMIMPGVGTAVGAVVGAVTNVVGGILGRNKARKKEEEAMKAKREAFMKSAGRAVREQHGQISQSAAAKRSASAAAGLEAAQEKYKLSTGGRVFSDEYLEFRKNKKMYNNGGRIAKLAVENNRESRPEHLKYEGIMGELKLFDLYNKKVTPIKKPVYNTDYSEINQHLEKGGVIEYEEGGSHGHAHSATSHAKRPEALKYEYEDGGLTMSDNMMESAGESSSGSSFSSNVNSFINSEQMQVGAKQGVKHGVKTGIKYGTTRAAAAGLLNKFGARVGSKFIPGVGQAWLMGDIGYYGTKWMTKQYAKAHDEIFSPALDAIQNLKGEDVRKKIENYTHTYGVSGIGSGYSAKFDKGGRISYDVEDYLSDNYKNFMKGGMIEEYKTGGMTKGEFSHDNNPLTVVDKNGQDTGMELTGGEGVFDQKAMTMLDKYKQNKDYSKAGKLVFSEMDSWKDAGTAKYGTRIKDY